MSNKQRRQMEYLGNRHSVQSALISEAILVADRKNLTFVGECAQWLRDVADGTAHRIFEPVGKNLAANDPRVMSEIKIAIKIFKRIVLELTKTIRRTADITVDSLKEILNAISPAPPVTE